MDIEARLVALKASYDAVAPEYAERIYHELDHKPLDRTLLQRLASLAGPLGPVCDLGCGPGHVAAFLKQQGADVLGVDLSPGMLAQARRLNPSIPFHQGDMLDLSVLEDESMGGVAAFYSLIHVPPEHMDQALAEIRQVLRPGGWLLAAFHQGTHQVRLESWWEQEVCLDFFFLSAQGMEQAIERAGLVVEETLHRAPYPDVEHPSQRVYILAQRPERG